LVEVRRAASCGILGGARKGGHIPTSRGQMTQSASVLVKSGWISLAIIGLAILVIGLITALMPASGGPLYLRAMGVASIGMGLFGLLITTIAYRRRERWAWFALWYYPVFWTAHLVGGLPPGKSTSIRSCSSYSRLRACCSPCASSSREGGHGNSRLLEVSDHCKRPRTP
jgi:hypothetical protein